MGAFVIFILAVLVAGAVAYRLGKLDDYVTPYGIPPSTKVFGCGAPATALVPEPTQ